MNDIHKPEVSEREPVLSIVDRVSEMLFGLFMALTFIGAVTIADAGGGIREMMIAAIGCNLAWGMVDGVMYLVRGLTERGRRLSLVKAVRAAPDAASGCALLYQALPPVATSLLSATEIEAIRQRVIALVDVPDRPSLNREDFIAALAIFLVVVAATFPVVLPFMLLEDVIVAKNLSRGIALTMLFFGGLALGRYAGYGSWRTGFAMAGLGTVMILAINALGG